MGKSNDSSPQHNETDLKNRALAAYWRSGKPGERIETPAADGVAVEQADGHFYVTISSSTALLACYRVRNDGKLKLLRRVPVVLKQRG